MNFLTYETKELGMALDKRIFKCDIYGNIVEVLKSRPADAACCLQDMPLQNENTIDGLREKQALVIEKKSDKFRVMVGSTPRRMNVNHDIMLIELMAYGFGYIKY